jgi:CubicO group peptidase (beta-lactamase class C family)
MKNNIRHLFYFVGLLSAGLVTAQQTATAPLALQPFVDKHELAGAIGLVVDREQVLAIETFGFADIAAGKAMPKNALFWIASQSKPITATAVIMLVDKGKINLDDPVEKYLPEFKGQQVNVGDKRQPPVHPITVREVLSHMSGLPFKSDVENPTLDALPLAEAVASYAKTPLQTEPGTHYQYSNAGINTSARILEVVSGMKYEDFLQERLFDPLGMKDTTFWPNDEQTKRIAKSYRPNAEKNNLDEFQTGQLSYPLSHRKTRFPMPAGGLFSSAEDTAKFCQMMLNGGELNGKRYVSEAGFKALTTRQTPESVKASYGLGYSVGGGSFGHGGAHASNMTVYPAKGVALIWMVQHGGFPGEGNKAQGVFKDWALKQFGK